MCDEIIVDPRRGMDYCEGCLDNDIETQGYYDWELLEGHCLCIDCASNRIEGKPVPQEWIIEH